MIAALIAATALAASSDGPVSTRDPSVAISAVCTFSEAYSSANDSDSGKQYFTRYDTDFGLREPFGVLAGMIGPDVRPCVVGEKYTILITSVNPGSGEPGLKARCVYSSWNLFLGRLERENEYEIVGSSAGPLEDTGILYVVGRHSTRCTPGQSYPLEILPKP